MSEKVSFSFRRTKVTFLKMMKLLIRHAETTATSWVERKNALELSLSKFDTFFNRILISLFLSQDHSNERGTVFYPLLSKPIIQHDNQLS